METNNRTREEKKVLREKFIKLRENIPEDEANKRSLLIIQQLLKLKNFNQAKNIMLYYPFRNEVNVTGLIDTCKDKTFYFPVVDFDNKTLVIRKYNGKFYKNKYGIFEPIYNNNNADVEILDFIIVPGVVFDIRCYRIGYGGGFYDKLLKNVKCLTCGVCFDIQIVDIIPVTQEDVPVDYVVSELRILSRKE